MKALLSPLGSSNPGYPGFARSASAALGRRIALRLLRMVPILAGTVRPVLAGAVLGMGTVLLTTAVLLPLGIPVSHAATT